eukprot:gnl/Spiro4/15031_TR8101_c0_g1_i1.p2 gnl/Spiro4/15031_TR8101_c0_g1~~gnl/Spiro4/15031_TR8101_c0_g1_i1.p2  ORF type:complete len:134 (+),score=1.94 gnl/Spiro4/15031_TR8101_c0_g1_i1:41-403(+)
MWCTSLPGVATMMCGFLARAIAWDMMSIPPTKTTHLRLMEDPKASNCSPICIANSLVGANITAYSGCGLSNKVCKMGNAKAPVLPDPVCANPIISLPFNAYGIDCNCIDVGFFHPILFIA